MISYDNIFQNISQENSKSRKINYILNYFFEKREIPSSIHEKKLNGDPEQYDYSVNLIREAIYQNSHSDDEKILFWAIKQSNLENEIFGKNERDVFNNLVIKLLISDNFYKKINSIF
ncbi:MAG: hypothetical protein Q4A42_01295 [Tissierellia bacterium]|nr:hypothetical protein [Tissierellia bacterium]